jgi:hypothetical protein
MSVTELSPDLEKNKILCRSLSERAFCVHVSEDRLRVAHIAEIELHMTRSFYDIILYPRTDSFDDLMFEEELSILIYLSSRDTKELGYLIGFEEIPYVHSDRAKIRIKYLILFLVETSLKR